MENMVDLALMLLFGNRSFFESHFGADDSGKYQNAVRRFVQSLAGYSIICYLLQVKDRWGGIFHIQSNRKMDYAITYTTTCSRLLDTTET